MAARPDRPMTSPRNRIRMGEGVGPSSPRGKGSGAADAVFGDNRIQPMIRRLQRKIGQLLRGKGETDRTGGRGGTQSGKGPVVEPAPIAKTVAAAVEPH